MPAPIKGSRETSGAPSPPDPTAPTPLTSHPPWTNTITSTPPKETAPTAAKAPTPVASSPVLLDPVMPTPPTAVAPTAGAAPPAPIYPQSTPTSAINTVPTEPQITPIPPQATVPGSTSSGPGLNLSSNNGFPS